MSSPEKIVYVIAPHNGPFKIGITNDIKQRLRKLNEGNHLYLKVWYSHEAHNEEDAKRIERELHHHYKEKHIRGEWFDLSIEEDIPDMGQTIRTADVITMCPENWSLTKMSCDEFTAGVCKSARGALGLSHSDLAGIAGISPDTVKDFETGGVASRLDTLDALRTALQNEGIRFERRKNGGPLKFTVYPKE